MHVSKKGVNFGNSERLILRRPILKKDILFKILFVAGVVLLALGLVFIALKETVPELIPLLEKGNVEDIQEYLRSNGTVKGVLCTILLQMVQVWSLFIAGMPIQVAAGCVYGFFKAFIICHLASTAAQLIAIIVWRKTGRRLQKWMPVNVERNRRFNEFLNSKAPPAYIVILVCMVPVIPNGLIALLASKMDISVKKYSFSVWLGSIVNVLLCCAAGNRIIQGDWVIACIFVAVLVTLFLCMWFFRDKILTFYYKITGEKGKGV